MAQLTASILTDEYLRMVVATCRRCCCGTPREYVDQLAEEALDGDESSREHLAQLLAARGALEAA